jgi:glycosyltransferase involved in cell wall biosynthesis
MLDFFPVISETFILQEILEMRKRGFEIVIFAQNRASDLPFNSIVHNESEELVRETRYLNDNAFRKSKLTKGFLHLREFFEQPIRYFRTLIYAYRRGRHILNIFKLAPFYVRWMKILNVEHIHAHFALTACELSMLISRITGIPYSFTVHAHDVYEKGVARDDISDLIRFSKFVVTCTEYNRNYLLHKYSEWTTNKVFLSYHGVDTKRFFPQCTKSNDMTSILSIGRLVEIKGFSYLIEAISILRKTTNLAFSLTIVGDGPERILLEEQVKTHNLDSVVTFKGNLPLEEVAIEYGDADIFVLPCIVGKDGNRDGIPNVIMEAMSSGLAVISTLISGIPEVIDDGKDGFLVPERDSMALASSIEILCRDSDLRKRIGKKAREKMINKFDKTEQIRELSFLLSES